MKSVTSPDKVPVYGARTGELAALQATVAVLMARDAQRAGELAALRAEVGGLKVALHLAGHDHDWLMVLADALPHESFTVQRVLQRADHHRQLQRAVSTMTARTIGARLKRLSRQPPPGFRLTQDGRDSTGCIWTLESP